MNWLMAVTPGYKLPRVPWKLNGKSLSQGDGAAVSDEKQLVVKGTADAEVLLFDLA